MGNLNKNMFNIIGYLLGDGWISISNAKNKGYVCGFSGDIEDLILLKNDLNILFGDIGKSTIVSKKTISPKYNIKGVSSYFTCNTKVAKYFLSLGLPYGKRVEKDFILPEFIINSSIEEKVEFISGLYAAEGEIPKMQKNDKTPRCPSMVISKRYSQKSNFYILLNQIGKMLNDINIKFNLELVETYTCDKNIKAKFVISNGNNNLTNFYKILNLKYCKRKQSLFDEFYKYQKLKTDKLKELEKAFNETRNTNLTTREIADKYNIKIRQVQHWRYDNQNLQFKLPKNFMTFTEFKNRYCSP